MRSVFLGDFDTFLVVHSLAAEEILFLVGRIQDFFFLYKIAICIVGPARRLAIHVPASSE